MCPFCPKWCYTQELSHEKHILFLFHVQATYLLKPSFLDKIILCGDKKAMIYPIVSPTQVNFHKCVNVCQHNVCYLNCVTMGLRSALIFQRICTRMTTVECTPKPFEMLEEKYPEVRSFQHCSI